MKRIAQLAALFLFAALPCAAAISVTQHKVNEITTSGTTVAVTITAPTVGHLLVVGGMNFGVRTITGVTDNKSGGSNTYTHATSCAGAGTGGPTGTTDYYYLLSSAGSPTTVTLQFSGTAGTDAREGEVWEVAGFTTPAQDGSCGIQNTGLCVLNLCTGPAITAATSSGFSAAEIINSNSIDQNPNSGNEYTAGGDITTTHDAFASLIYAASGTHTPVWHDTAAAASFVASTIAFKETASGTFSPHLMTMGVGD